MPFGKPGWLGKNCAAEVHALMPDAQISFYIFTRIGIKAFDGRYQISGELNVVFRILGKHRADVVWS